MDVGLSGPEAIHRLENGSTGPDTGEPPAGLHPVDTVPNESGIRSVSRLGGCDGKAN